MVIKSKLVGDVESLLEAAKVYDVEGADKRARLDLIARLDALREGLEDPVEKMFSQITNVCFICRILYFTQTLIQCSTLKQRL
jgi:hypothetical protein